MSYSVINKMPSFKYLHVVQGKVRDSQSVISPYSEVCLAVLSHGCMSSPEIEYTNLINFLQTITKKN